MQKAYNKLDIVVNIAVCTHFNMIAILASLSQGLLKLANMNHIEIRTNCYIDTKPS